MGSYTSVAAFAQRIDEMGRIVARPNDRATIDAALVFGEVIDAAADGAGATSFAGQRRPKYRAHKRGRDVYIRPGNVGANVVLNSGARPHIIGASGRGTRARFRNNAGRLGATLAFGGSNTGQFGRIRRTRSGSDRAKALTIGDDFATFAFHPGMSGFGFVGKSAPKATEKGAQVYLAAKRRELGGGALR